MEYWNTPPHVFGGMEPLDACMHVLKKFRTHRDMAGGHSCRARHVPQHMVNHGVGANGARILGAKSIELMFKNHLPDGKGVAEMENKVNSQSFGLMCDSLTIRGMGYGLGGTVPLGDRHQVDDCCLAMPEGSYSWSGIAGTDVIIDPANDLKLFCTQFDGLALAL